MRLDLWIMRGAVLAGVTFVAAGASFGLIDLIIAPLACWALDAPVTMTCGARAGLADVAIVAGFGWCVGMAWLGFRSWQAGGR